MIQKIGYSIDEIKNKEKYENLESNNILFSDTICFLLVGEIKYIEIAKIDGKNQNNILKEIVLIKEFIKNFKNGLEKIGFSEKN